MVKLGFIVEGGSEKIIVESDSFQHWLQDNGMIVIRPVINAEGGGNLLPQNIEPMVATLQQSQPDHIVILTDLEHDLDERLVKQRIGDTYTNLIFVAIKALEAWYLADSAAMQRWLGVANFYEDNPQETLAMPWERLSDIARQLNKRGTGPSKIKFAEKMIKCGFDIVQAAQHPHCTSVRNFHDGLLALREDINS